MSIEASHAVLSSVEASALAQTKRAAPQPARPANAKELSRLQQESQTVDTAGVVPADGEGANSPAPPQERRRGGTASGGKADSTSADIEEPVRLRDLTGNRGAQLDVSG